MYSASPSCPRYGSVRPASRPVTVETWTSESERSTRVSRSRSPNAVYARRMTASPLIAMAAETYSAEKGRSFGGTFGTDEAIRCMSP